MLNRIKAYLVSVISVAASMGYITLDTTHENDDHSRWVTDPDERLLNKINDELAEAAKWSYTPVEPDDKSIWNSTNYNYKALSVQDLYQSIPELVQADELAKQKQERDIPDYIRKQLTEEIENLVKIAISKIEDMAANHVPFKVNRDACVVNNLRGSIMSRLVGVEPGKETKLIITVEHNAVNRCKGLTFNKKLRKRFADAAIKVLVEYGVTVSDKNEKNEVVEHHYAFNTATASQLKEGKCYMIHSGRWAALRKYFNLNVKERVNNVLGANYLKWYAPLWTPSAPVLDQFGHGFSLSNVIVFSDITMKKVAKYGIQFDENWKAALKNFVEICQTIADGGAYAIVENFPEFQLRAGAPWIDTMKAMLGNGWKAFWHVVEQYHLNLEDTIPVPTIDGKFLKVKDLIGKVVTFESTWKCKKVQDCTFAEGAELLEKMSEDFPHINELFAVRFANESDDDEEVEAEEDGFRNMSRQSIQQMITAKDEVIKVWLDKSFKYTSKWTKAARVAAEYRKDNVVADIFKWYPQTANATQCVYRSEVNYIRNFHKIASGKVRVKGLYPYILIDAVAIFELLLVGKKPEEVMGSIPANCISCSGLKDGQRAFVNRYPSNHLVGDNVVNFALDIYADSAICWLSIHDFLLIRMDGDTDGDEILITTDMFVINFFDDVKKYVNLPVIDFDHGSAKDVSVELVAESIEAAIYNGQAYYLVGRYSNLATKILGRICRATTAKELRELLIDAAYAHVATILCIDAVKTGNIPSGLIMILEGDGVHDGLTAKYAEMPWNQRFTKGIDMVWTDPRWNNDKRFKTERESQCVCDRLARIFVNGMGTRNNETRIKLGLNFVKEASDFVWDPSDVGEFDPKMLLFRPESKYTCHGGIVENEFLKRLNENTYSNDSIVAQIRNGKRVKPHELFMFLFQNAAGLERGLANNPNGDDIREEYYRAVKEIMISLDSYNDRFVVADHFIRDALEIGIKSNKAGSTKTATALDIRKEKGRYFDFVLHVFADEIRENLIRNGFKAKYEAEHPEEVEQGQELDPDDRPFCE